MQSSRWGRGRSRWNLPGWRRGRLRVSVWRAVEMKASPSRKVQEKRLDEGLFVVVRMHRPLEAG